MWTTEELIGEASRAFRPLRRREYDRLVEMGAFEDEKVELLEGMIVPMSPQGVPHAKIIQRLTKLLLAAVGERADLRVQAPLAASDTSEPEPDLALVEVDDDWSDHPARAFLVIEVADSSLARDRGTKASIYARAGFPELWVLDAKRRRAHVYRAPSEGRYTRVTEHEIDATLAIEAFPDVRVRLADLFPRA